MRFRVGLVVGFGIGYYLGAKAGRERYEQLRDVLAELGEHRPLEKLEALVDLTVERLRGEADRATTIHLLGAETHRSPYGGVQDSSR